MDYNTGSLRVLFSEIYTTVLSCAEGVVPVSKVEEDPDNLSDRDNPDYLGEPDDPDNQDIPDEPNEFSTDKNQININDLSLIHISEPTRPY